MPFRRRPGRPRNEDPPAPSRRIDVRVPLDLLERLEALADARGITRHQAIREAIAEWVEKREDQPREEPRQD